MSRATQQMRTLKTDLIGAHLEIAALPLKEPRPAALAGRPRHAPQHPRGPARIIIVPAGCEIAVRTAGIPGWADNGCRGV